MLKLGVNIDHVATLREARYRGQKTGEPCPVDAALTAEGAGAHGITAHLREDRRHIQDADMARLRKAVATRLNMEMANTAPMVRFALKLKPEIVCLVPEKREELTTEGGLDVVANEDWIRDCCARLADAGIEMFDLVAACSVARAPAPGKRHASPPNAAPARPSPLIVSVRSLR